MTTLLVVAAIIVALMLWRRLRGPTLRNPAQVVAFALKNYDRMQRSDWQRMERGLAKHAPDAPERALIYCLRVSSVVPAIQNRSPFLSRANAVFIGDDSCRSLMFAERARHYVKVRNFLERLYSQKFYELVSRLPENRRPHPSDMPFELLPESDCSRT